MAAGETMYQDRTAETSKYFDRLQAYSTSQAAVMQQSYGVQQPGGMPSDMSYQQRIRAISDNQYSSASGTDMTNYRRVMAREQEIYREKLNASISRYSAEAIPGAFMGFWSGMAAPYMAMSPLAKFHEKQQEYRYAGYQFANSIDTFADKTGTRNFSYAQSNQLGNVLRDRSFQGGSSQFFGMSDLNRMNQIGAANGLLNVGNVAGGNSIENQTKEYARQFDQLRKNTEMVVKTLKTTMEGGLKVIKDMKAMGVSDTQIQSFVGKMAGGAAASGMSYQGFQTLGGVGAQLAQQSGMNAMVGISGIQTAAMQLSQQNFYDPRMRNVINSVGGVANAAAMVSQANMSLLNTPVGTKMMAAMMNRDAKTGAVSFDEGAQDRLLNGKMSGYEITSRANAYGYKVGAAGRFMAKYDFQEAYQNLNAQQRDKMMRSYIGAWGNSYLRQGGKREWAYGALESLGITDTNQVRLLAENYLRPEDTSLYSAADKYGALMQQSNGSPGRAHRGLFGGNLNYGMYNTTKALAGGAYAVGNVVGSPIMLGLQVSREIKRALPVIGAFFENPADPRTLGPDRSNMASREDALALQTGLRRTTYGEIIRVDQILNERIGTSGQRTKQSQMAFDILNGKSTAKSDAQWVRSMDPGAVSKIDRLNTGNFNDVSETLTRLLADRASAVQNFKSALGTNLRTSVDQSWGRRSDEEIMRFLEGMAQHVNERTESLNESERRKYGIVVNEQVDKRGRKTGVKTTTETLKDYNSDDYRQIKLNSIVAERMRASNGSATADELSAYANAEANKLQIGSVEATSKAANAAVYQTMGPAAIAARRGVAWDAKNYQAAFKARDEANAELSNVLSDAAADVHGRKRKLYKLGGVNDTFRSWDQVFKPTETMSVMLSMQKNKSIQSLVEKGDKQGAADLIQKTYGNGGMSNDTANKIAEAMTKALKANGVVSDTRALQSFERQLERRISSVNGDDADSIKKAMRTLRTTTESGTELFSGKEGLKLLKQMNEGLSQLGSDIKLKAGSSIDDIAKARDFLVTNTKDSSSTVRETSTASGLVSSAADDASLKRKMQIADALGFQFNANGDYKFTLKGGGSLNANQQTALNQQVGEANIKMLRTGEATVAAINVTETGTIAPKGGTSVVKLEQKDREILLSAANIQKANAQNNNGGTSTGQSSPTVNSPILNYWNNNWSFSGK